jgi:ankyrin repeat protein
VVDEPNFQGDLPIHTAAREGMLPILKFLIEEKNVNVMQNNKLENKRPLNLSRQSLHDRPNEPQHKECTHYLFDKDETG